MGVGLSISRSIIESGDFFVFDPRSPKLNA